MRHVLCLHDLRCRNTCWQEPHLGRAGQMNRQGELPTGLDWDAPIAAIDHTSHGFLCQVKESCDAFRKCWAAFFGASTPIQPQ